MENPLVITLFILLKDKIKLKIFELFTTLFSVSITLGVFFWLVSFFFGKSFYLGDCRVGERIFELYPFYVIEYVPFQLFEINRFSSVFDEPGMLGTLSVFVLAAKKFQLGEDYRLIPILVGGIVSASLAFYALAVFYWLFSFQIKFKQIVYLVIIVLVFLLVDKVLDGVLLERILFRLNVSDVSELDNRMSNSFGHIFNHYLQTDNIILGMGHNAHTAFGGGSDGLKVFFYNYGLVGFFLLSVAFIVLVLAYKIRLKDIALLVVYGFSFYQRAGIYRLYQLLILVGGLIILNHYQDEKRKHFRSNSFI